MHFFFSNTHKSIAREHCCQGDLTFKVLLSAWLWDQKARCFNLDSLSSDYHLLVPIIITTYSCLRNTNKQKTTTKTVSCEVKKAFIRKIGFCFCLFVFKETLVSFNTEGVWGGELYLFHTVLYVTFKRNVEFWRTT